MNTELDIKYRPKSFAELIGKSQREAARTLAGLFENGRPPRQVLLSGPPGVGKTTTARIIARCFMCEDGPTSAPCGGCSFCAANHSPNVVEINGAMRRH